MTAVMRLADAVRPVVMNEDQPSVSPPFPPENSAGRKHTCVDHDQELHQAVVDVAGCGRLDDEDILVSDRLADCDTGLLVGVVQTHSLRDLYPEPVPPMFPVSACAVLCALKMLLAGWCTDRSATSRASKGWEFPLRSLISFDIVDMVENKMLYRGRCDPPFEPISTLMSYRSYRLQSYCTAMAESS